MLGPNNQDLEGIEVENIIHDFDDTEFFREPKLGLGTSLKLLDFLDHFCQI